MGYSTNVTNFSVPFLQLTMQLVMSTFTHDFSRFNGELLYKNFRSDVEKPEFYIYHMYSNNALIIGTRGTIDINDTVADLELKEINTNKGTFSEGFYRAALFVYEHAYGYIKTHTDGPIYIIGHSAGASISTVVHCLAMFDFGKERDINCIAMAPVPAISEQLNQSYGHKIVTIINGIDVVPTISIPNIHHFMKNAYPLLDVFTPWSVIKGLVEITLKAIHSWSDLFKTDNVYEAIARALRNCIDSLILYGKGELKLAVRYPPGSIFRITAKNPMPLSQTVIDARKEIDVLSLWPSSLTSHDPSLYREAINLIPSD